MVGNLSFTCMGDSLAPHHQKRSSDVYRRNMMIIIAEITESLTILINHNVNNRAITIGCDGASKLRVSQDYHTFHPVDKYNTNLKKGIL